MQRITLHRLYQVSGITAAVVLVLLLIGTSTGRETLAWIYLTATDAIANATHVHGFPLDRLDPTCPQCMSFNPTTGGFMKVTLTNRRKWLIGAGAVLLLTATPSFALFGIGDIVFDPTSYASLVSQLTTLESQYNMLKNNITHFSAKQLWQTELHALKNVNVASMFGETAGIKIALNSNNPSASLTGWQTATVPMNSNASTYLAGQQLGSSRMSQLAMIETADGVSPDCLTAMGQYRSGRTTNLTANSSLMSSQFDNTDATNAEVQQLNLLNAAEGQKMAEMQSQGSLQVCLAGQMTVANMERRNAAVEDMNTAAFVQQQRSTNDVSAANEGSTWTTYIP